MPANLAVTAYAIDTDKKEVSQDRILVEVRNTVKGSPDGTTPVTSPMDIRIYEKTKGALKTIDGLVLKFLNLRILCIQESICMEPIIIYLQKGHRSGPKK